jgi:hypothetical protein
MSRRRLLLRSASCAVAFAAALLSASQAAIAGVFPFGAPGIARLQGQFELDGTVTTAERILGERVGDSVDRIWSFTPLCPTGSCAQITLVRPRSNGTDTVVLERQTPGHYVGRGVFYAPLRCSRRTYPTGVRVPFSITVAVTQALVINGVTVSSRIAARYNNRSRMNQTPCVAGSLGHDAATYHGHLLL